MGERFQLQLQAQRHIRSAIWRKAKAESRPRTHAQSLLHTSTKSAKTNHKSPHQHKHTREHTDRKRYKKSRHCFRASDSKRQQRSSLDLGQSEAEAGVEAMARRRLRIRISFRISFNYVCQMRSLVSDTDSSTIVLTGHSDPTFCEITAKFRCFVYAGEVGFLGFVCRV